ncbi:MAG: hypothetical protein AAFP89_23830 [Bacteroidota bacterium]
MRIYSRLSGEPTITFWLRLGACLWEGVRGRGYDPLGGHLLRQVATVRGCFACDAVVRNMGDLLTLSGEPTITFWLRLGACSWDGVRGRGYDPLGGHLLRQVATVGGCFACGDLLTPWR